MSAVSWASSRRCSGGAVDRRAHARELAREQDQHHAQVADDREQQPAQSFGAAGTAARGIQRPDFLGRLLAVDQVAQRRGEPGPVSGCERDTDLLQAVQDVRGSRFAIQVQFFQQLQGREQFRLNPRERGDDAGVGKMCGRRGKCRARTDVLQGSVEPCARGIGLGCRWFHAIVRTGAPILARPSTRRADPLQSFGRRSGQESDRIDRHIVIPSSRWTCVCESGVWQPAWLHVF